MFSFVRKYHTGFSMLLTVIFSFYTTSCVRIFKRSEVPREKAMTVAKEPIQFFVLDELFPNDFAWRLDNVMLNASRLDAQLVRLSKKEAHDVNRRSSNMDAKRSRHHVVFYVKNAYAQTFFDSTNISLAFDQISRTEVYKIAPLRTVLVNVPLVVLETTTAFVLVVIVALVSGSTSCPFVYADNPDGAVLEGEPYVGATHPQLERHDWLALPDLQGQGGFYQLRVANEAAEIQHINLLELVAVDHPAGMPVLYDKYGKLHTLTNAQGPETATNLEGVDVRSIVSSEDNQIYFGNAGNANARAEDGLDLTFRRPAGSKQAKLILRAKNSPWLDYAHESLQRDLGKYGPKVRQKFMEKDSAALQQWALDQNIPLSVWLETSPENWERAGFFNLAGAESMRRDVLPLDLSSVSGDQVHLKLTSGYLFWEIDGVALDFSADQPLQTRVLPAVSAVDQEGKDLSALLRAGDNQYYIQSKTGDKATLRFQAPPLAAGNERSLFLHAKGHYQILREPVEGSPSRRDLRQFTQADAFPIYAREKWNTFARRDTIWAASQHP